ncbi:MAG: hypothetical protein QXU18_11775 [Thermoplasmatales archaeon]
MTIPRGFSTREEAEKAADRLKNVYDRSADKTLPPDYVDTLATVLSETKPLIKLAFYDKIADAYPELIEVFKNVKSVPKKNRISSAKDKKDQV